MIRVASPPRENWQSIVEKLGMDFHSNGDKKPYWNEAAYYQFTMAQIDEIEKATNELEDLCLALVNNIVLRGQYEKLGIGMDAARLIAQSWDDNERNIYGRFDFSMGVDGSLKLLEYNADTPTSLLEAAVVQWQWLKDKFPDLDQFNSIHERLIEAWKESGVYDLAHFAALKEPMEDIMTVSYMQDTAHQAGIDTQFIHVEDIGVDAKTGHFVDLEGRRIKNCFKLYPWEWMMEDEFGKSIPKSGTRFIEPAWKMILSNKAMLALLWEMAPDCKYLLPTFFDVPYPPEKELRRPAWVKKPFLSREGANIKLLDGYKTVISETPGAYFGPCVYQHYHETLRFREDGASLEVTPIIGSWVIASEAAGIGIREDYGITTNMASFVPHVIKG